MAEISARSSVSSLRSLSVHLDPRSFLGVMTLQPSLIEVIPAYAWLPCMVLMLVSGDPDCDMTLDKEDWC